jgi:hypothetical protein
LEQIKEFSLVLKKFSVDKKTLLLFYNVLVLGWDEGIGSEQGMFKVGVPGPLLM